MIVVSAIGVDFPEKVGFERIEILNRANRVPGSGGCPLASRKLD